MAPPSTCTICDTAIRATLPALGAVIAASIFIASIVATVCPARTTSPSATLTRDDPGEGCRDVAGVVEISFLGGRHRPGDGRTSTVFWLQSDREVVATAKPVSPMRLAAAACAWI